MQVGDREQPPRRPMQRARGQRLQPLAGAQELERAHGCSAIVSAPSLRHPPAMKSGNVITPHD